jgi:hypothetical protein
MLRQEGEHTARLEQTTDHRLGVQQFPLIPRPTLHPKIIPNHQDQQGQASG